MKRAGALVLMALLLLGLPVPAHAANSSWAVIDAETGRLLLGANEDVPMPIASLTKVWTAFTILDGQHSLQDHTTISAAAASSEGSSIYLKQGKAVPVEALLYGLMLRSGNDAAHALAEYAAGSVEGFVHLMNEKALYYGLENTFFSNPSGLHADEHLSTAYETALMMRYAMQNAAFKEIASSPTYSFTLADKSESYHWKNKHRLIHSTKSAVAGKTGFTKAAGRTLVTYFEEEDKKIIIVTLNDGNDWENHLALAEKVFANYEVQTLANKGSYLLFPGIFGHLKEPINILMKQDEQRFIAHQVMVPRRLTSKGRWIVYLDDHPVLSLAVEVNYD